MGDDFEAFVGLAKTYTGLRDLDESWLDQVWHGADSNMNIAINHVLDSREKKRRQPAEQPARGAPLQAVDIDMDPSMEQEAEAETADLDPPHPADFREELGSAEAQQAPRRAGYLCENEIGN